MTAQTRSTRGSERPQSELSELRALAPEQFAEKRTRLRNLLSLPKLNDSVRAAAEYELGKSFQQTSDHDSALSVLRTARVRKGSKELSAEIFNALGAVFYLESRMDSAMACYLKALSLFESDSNRLGLAKTYNNLSIVHRSTRDLPEAKFFSREALGIYAELGDSARYGQSLNTLGTLYLAGDEKDSALALFERSVRIKRRHDKAPGLASSLNNWAMLLAERGDPRAEGLFLEALELRKGIGDRKGQASVLINLSEYWMRKNQLDRAIKATDQVPPLFEHGDAELRLRYHQRRAELLETLHRPDEALFHLKQALLYTDSLHDQTSARHVLELERSFSRAQDEAQIQLLKAENLERAARMRTQQLAVIGLLTLTTLSLIALGLFHSKNRSIRQLNQRLDEARQNAEDQALFRSTVLQNMTHELRTPLNGILGLSELLEQETQGRQREMVRMLSVSARRLLDSIQSILGFGTLEAGRTEAIPGSHRIDLLLAQVFESFQPLSKASEVPLEIEVPRPLRWSTDAVLLKVIVQNLISNALKYSPKGSTVSLGVRQEDNHLLIWVDDAGPGVPPEDRERIFKPYIQGSQGLSKTHQGTGLGLAIASGYAELLRGSLEYHPLETGSRFVLRLPEFHRSEDSGAESPS
ncbi:tetratricopeptide repeat protein [bacterium]|nr:tetratricopeptide repeat protein [bacterium]